MTYNEMCDAVPVRDKLVPTFNSSCRSLGPAMIDHVEVVVGDWPVSGKPQDIIRFQNAIPSMMAISRSGEVVPVFTATNNSKDGRWVEVDVSRGKRGNVAYQVRPIFGGKLCNAKGAGRVPRQTRGEHIRLGLDTHLNVNHFLNAQGVRCFTRLDRPRLVEPLATALDGTPAAYGTEYCLTDDVNVLVGPKRLYRYVLSKTAEEHFMDCFRLTETFISADLQDTANSYGVSIGHSPYYSLRKIEFVWEFSHPNPIRFVEGLDVPMRALGTQSRRHRALVRGECLHVRRDSIAVGAELSAGCVLVAYAKTNERVRFEVRLDRDAIAAMLRRGKDDPSRTARTHDDLQQMVATLRDAATQRMEGALAALDRQLIPPASHVTAIQLCAEVGRILQDDALARTVLETLSMRGSLASAQETAMRGAADQLIAANLLRRSAPRSPVFVPTERYVRAVQELRDMGAKGQALALAPRRITQQASPQKRGLVRHSDLRAANRN